jgi:SPP1 gp7 family putative phage head morphogenesis protein
MDAPFEYDWDALMDAIASGIVTVDDLPPELYAKTADYLAKGVKEGFVSETAYIPDEELLIKLQTSVYRFSAAKTYQSVSQMQQLARALVKDGRVATYSEYKQEAQKVLNQFYDNYLRTEYNTSVGQSQNAVKWAEFENDQKNFDYLVYDAILDENTSDICRPLDGITLPVNDKFWDTHGPLNHFNCRCFLRKQVGGKPTPKKDVQRAYKETTPKMDDSFMNNPGKTGEVFTKAHPYYNVPKKDRKKIKTNFGLPKDPNNTKE